MSCIRIGMADYGVSKAPDVLVTIGLGSCVGVTLYDPVLKVGGLAHIMLPCSHQYSANSTKGKFADTAIDVVLEKLKAMGAVTDRLVSKLAGGARMFEIKSSDERLKIGDRNIEAAIKVLKSRGIPIVAKDVGGTYGRTIELHLEDGSLVVKTIGRGVKIL
ncbi:chemotaxis protein CheD [Caldanaerobius polysaccharolyticus]|uniref:chemotaxis protein CheD n=1 Tax=Caldanaerobius polysaccharolyticus TaxID=44256 RepID=UPI00047E0D42|nr:chemotaxis protein CheD [Caldanaerobius polysaccharolyticus]